VKVDLHVHTQERSPCARTSEDEQIRAAIAAGLDVIFITDHWKLVPQGRLEELNRQYAPLRIFGGIEITVDGEDVLILGVPDARLEKNHWDYISLHAFVQERGGFLAIAHPFRYHAHIGLPIDQYKPDAIEVYSPNTPLAAEGEIRSIAGRLAIPLLSDSDAHTSERIGMYFNLLQGQVTEEREVIEALKAGGFALYWRQGTNQTKSTPAY
jgi:predicted metal-dependent phosphoesterase TrpH